MQKQWSKHRSIIPMLNDGTGTLASSPLMLKHNTEVYFSFPHKWSIIVCSERTFGKNLLTQEPVHWFASQINLLVPIWHESPPEVICELSKKVKYSKTSLYSDQVVFVTMSTSPYNFIYIYLYIFIYINKIRQKNNWLCRPVVRFLLMIALADLLTFLLYFSESRIKSQNSTVVPIFQNLSLFISVFYCVSRKYFGVLWQW